MKDRERVKGRVIERGRYYTKISLKKVTQKVTLYKYIMRIYDVYYRDTAYLKMWLFSITFNLRPY